MSHTPLICIFDFISNQTPFGGKQITGHSRGTEGAKP